jgi:hypothetical protein
MYKSYSDYNKSKKLIVNFIDDKIDTKSNGRCAKSPKNKEEFQKSFAAATGAFAQ